jgi:hypothetical protein
MYISTQQKVICYDSKPSTVIVRINKLYNATNMMKIKKLIKDYEKVAVSHGPTDLIHTDIVDLYT